MGKFMCASVLQTDRQTDRVKKTDGLTVRQNTSREIDKEYW